MMAHLPTYKDHDYIYRAAPYAQLKRAAKDGKIGLNALNNVNYPGQRIRSKGLEGLNNVGYWDSTIPQDWGLPWHRNEGIEISFLENGELPFEVYSRNEYLLQPNDLAITPPWQPHQVGNPNIGISKLYWFIIDVNVREPLQTWQWPSWIILNRKDLKKLTDLIKNNDRPVLQTNDEIRRCFKRIGKSVKKILAGGSTSSIGVHINEVLIHLLDIFQSQNIAQGKKTSGALIKTGFFLEEIKANIDTDWTLESMADSCRVGVTRFVHYCKQIKNMTPMQYLNRLRVEKAATLLVGTPNMKVIDIALECGFYSSQYFATVFRNFYDCTPKEYRHREPLADMDPKVFVAQKHPSITQIENQA
jgi:AraC-like DNA-binding protein